ncbi:hypothetical protein [uncultured Roseibium sp.]|uniref:hypothetical protein n=1 Tax=uncultured Roseibium sp. TaxID=1936171 RepID=UPI00263453E2|nr:hypothetical protein [uncultured Roseibium sp.]
MSLPTIYSSSFNRVIIISREASQLRDQYTPQNPLPPNCIIMQVVFASEVEFPYRAFLPHILATWDSRYFSNAFTDWEARENWLSSIEKLADGTEPALRALPEEWQSQVRHLAGKIHRELTAFETPECTTWMRFWPALLIAMSVSVSHSFFKLGEVAFPPRSVPYYSVNVVLGTLFLVSPKVTPAACWRLFVNFGSTLPVYTILYFIPANVEKLKYLYERTWYNILATALTILVVFFVQFFRYVKNFVIANGPSQGPFALRWQPICPAISQEDMLDCLRRVEDPFWSFSSGVSRCHCDYIFSMRLGMVKGEWFPYLLEILNKTLNKKNRLLREGERTSLHGYSSVLALHKAETYSKYVMNVLFFVFGVANLVGLTVRRQYGSAGQTIFAMFSVGIYLGIKTVKQGVPLDDFNNYIFPHLGFMLVSFLAVTLPLLVAPDWFDGPSEAFKWTLVGALAYYYLGAGLLSQFADAVSLCLRNKNSSRAVTPKHAV